MRYYNKVSPDEILGHNYKKNPQNQKLNISLF